MLSEWPSSLLSSTGRLLFDTIPAILVPSRDDRPKSIYIELHNDDVMYLSKSCECHVSESSLG